MSDEKSKVVISNSFFIVILVAVIISWILVQLWTTAIEVFCYDYMGLSRKSAFAAFLIAAFFTIIFIIYATGTETGETIKENLVQVSVSTPNVARQIVSIPF